MDTQPKPETGNPTDGSVKPPTELSSPAPADAIPKSPETPVAEAVPTPPATQSAPSAVPAPPAAPPAPKPPTPVKPRADNTARKPILPIVLSMVFFVLLCAVAYYAYSKSN